MAAILQIRRGSGSVSLSDGELYLNKETQSLQIGSNEGIISLAKLNSVNSGSFNVSGDITLGGTITIGDTTTDSIVINADLDSNIIPNIDKQYNLGSNSRWYKSIYVETVSASFISGTIAGVGDIVAFSASVDARIVQLQGATSSLESFTSSQETKNFNLSTYTESLDTKLISVGYSTASLNTFTASQQTKDLTLATYTGSVDSKFIAVQSSTTSLNMFTASQEARNSTLATYTGSTDGRLNNLETYTSSLRDAITVSGVGAASTTTIRGNLTVAGTTTSINSTTVQIGDSIIELNYASGISNAGLLVKDATVPNLASGSLLWDATNDYWMAGIFGAESKLLRAGGDGVISQSAQLGDLNAFTASTLTRLGLIESSTGSLNTFTSSTSGRLNNLESKSSSVDTKFITIGLVTASLYSFTSSTNIRLGLIESSTGSLNSYTSSNDTKLSAIATITGSLITSASNTETKFIAVATITGSLISSASSDATKFLTLATYTGSTDIKFIAVQNSTASLNTFTASQETKNSTLASFTASGEIKNSTLATYTASLETKNLTLATYTASLETKNTSLATITGSLISSASNIALSQSVDSIKFTTLGTYTGSVDIKFTSVQSSTSSINTFTSSQETKNSTLSTYTASIDTKFTTVGIITSSLIAKTGSYAITGSNIFQGNQTITGSLYISADLIVQGSSSIQYISQSTLNIGTNVITVNTINPSTRFGGLAVIDSGSQTSGSILFDSINNQWIFVHQAGPGASVTSSVLLMAPQSVAGLGNETNLTNGRVPKSLNAEHLGDSNITDTGVLITLGSNTSVTGQLTATGFSGSLASTNGVVSGSSQIVLQSTIGFTGYNTLISVMTGSLLLTGSDHESRIDALEGVAFGGLDIAGQFEAIQRTTSSLNEFTSSTAVRLNLIETSTGSLNIFSASAITRLNSLESVTASIVAYTTSVDTKFVAVQSSTASLNTFTASQETKNLTLATFTGSGEIKWSTIQLVTASLQAFTASQETKNTSLAIITGSLISSASNDVTKFLAVQSSTASLNSFTGSQETKDTSLATLTGSLIISASNDVTKFLAVQSSTASLNQFTASSSTSFAELNLYTSSLKNAITVTGVDASSTTTIKGTLIVQGTTTTVNSTTIQLGDNIIELNGNGAVGAGLLVRDVNTPNTTSGSLLWDSSFDYWKGGALGAESKFLRAGGDGVLSGSIDFGTLLEPLNTFSASILSYTTSVDTKFIAVQRSTASLNQFTSSFNTNIKSQLDANTVISGSSQVNFTQISNLSANIVSASTDTANIDITIGGGSISANLKGGVVSGSSQIDATATTNFATGVKTRLDANTVISGSSQVNFTQISNLSANIISASTDTANVDIIITGGSISANLKGGVVSGSSQITAGSTTNFATDVKTQLNSNTVISGSSQVNANTITNFDSNVLGSLNTRGVISGSSQVLLTATTGFGTYLNQGVLTTSDVQFDSIGVGVAASTITGEIRATGDIVAFYSSDERLKENIQPITNALDKVDLISGNTYDWKEGFDTIHSHRGHDIGVIAQELEKVLPEVVTDRENGYKAVNYEKIVPLLIEAIKELNQKIKQLESK